MSEIKVPAWWDKGPFLDGRMIVSFLAEGPREFYGTSFIRALTSIMRAPPS